VPFYLEKRMGLRTKKLTKRYEKGGEEVPEGRQRSQTRRRENSAKKGLNSLVTGRHRGEETSDSNLRWKTKSGRSLSILSFMGAEHEKLPFDLDNNRPFQKGGRSEKLPRSENPVYGKDTNFRSYDHPSPRKERSWVTAERD